MAWGKAGSDTLTSAGDLLDGTITASPFIQFLFHTPTTGGSSNTAYQFDGTNQMALRYNQNGGTDGTSVSDTPPEQVWVSYGDHFNVNYYSNVTGKEKLGIIFDVTAGTTGAGTAPARQESVQKSVQSAQITRVRISNTAAGNYDISSNLSVLGSDITPAAGTPFAENAQAGSRAEITDTRKMYHYESNITVEDDLGTDKGWSIEGTGNAYDGTNDELDFNITADTSFDYALMDFQDADWLGVNISDTAFVVRTKLDIDTVTVASSNENQCYFGFFSSNVTSGTAQDFMGFEIVTKTSGSVKQLGVHLRNGATLLWDASVIFTHTLAVETLYVEFIRNGDKMTINLYSDSAYSVLVESQEDTVTGISALRYFGFKNRGDAQNNGGITAGSIDNIEIYNGVTSVDTTWTEEGT